MPPVPRFSDTRGRMESSNAPEPRANRVMIPCTAWHDGAARVFGILDPLPDVTGDPAQRHAGGIHVQHPRHEGGRYPLPPGPESGREPQGRIPYAGTSACRRTCSRAGRPCGRRSCIRDMPPDISSSTAATVPASESLGITCASAACMCLQQMFLSTKNGHVRSRPDCERAATYHLSKPPDRAPYAPSSSPHHAGPRRLPGRASRLCPLRTRAGCRRQADPAD